MDIVLTAMHVDKNGELIEFLMKVQITVHFHRDIFNRDKRKAFHSDLINELIGSAKLPTRLSVSQIESKLTINKLPNAVTIPRV